MHEIVVAYVQFVLNIPLNYAKSVFLAGMTAPEGKAQDPPPENQHQDSNPYRVHYVLREEKLNNSEHFLLGPRFLKIRPTGFRL